MEPGKNPHTDPYHELRETFQDRFSDVTGDLKEGYYNLNGDLYYKGMKVQGNTYSMPTYVTHQDTKTGRTTNTQKKKAPLWVILIIFIIMAPCLFNLLGTIMSLIFGEGS